MKGKVYLIGAGPGDPGLITVKGREILCEADVVMYDALANPELLALCKEGAELIDSGKRGGDHHLRQWETNELLVKYANEGKTVVRLKGGDPFLFGRGAEEAQELREAGAEVHVVPGVSSSISVPELAGIPVTHRDHASMVTFVTGHEKEDRKGDRVDWKALADSHGTIVVLMGLGNAATISKGLIDGGMAPDTPAAVITSGSTTEQRVEITEVSMLAYTIEDKKMLPPGIMVIGSVASLRGKLGDLQ
ncbi:MAG: uroporphyrinogen-III C-methyltransferase [Candidatus Methanomethylophilaceae archaeon]|jgi:uroporphyrin-III C-methyltransferase|nr:uroporphyrinogen-III C-methyltransferase [Candidatus Methanomethylophilaceae archaeon]NCA73541.1 uroporphyrinogen-III C-methyltransferase [Gammaproteobacteria bacterium]MDD2936087.1 uroporphyrinogen-III C-methyltransferase [Candidatus Methanomethylophilaceae archaeon]MDD3351679.1 uroporphyrinogen-III C-methyltransferase [Candidatus Methanomethylophilaceae archaeon]MDD3986144.1 uroporphyrinogen-III C-methyltransferase [Candidatus Methanomethylophilaceae archaeon]